MTRTRAGLFVLITIAMGIASRKIHLGVFLWDKSLGDALYAVMIYFFLALARPTLPPKVLGLAAFAISFAIELFQLTGIPARLPFPINRILGTTFEWHDVACYVIGAAMAAGAHHLIERRRASSST